MIVEIVLGGLVAGVAFFGGVGVMQLWGARRVKFVPPPKRAARMEPERKMHRRGRISRPTLIWKRGR